MNTKVYLDIDNNERLAFSFNLRKLIQLKTKDYNLYKEVNKSLTKGPEDIEDMLKILYAAYLIALEDMMIGMSYNDFLEKASDTDIPTLLNIIENLISPKKN